MLLAEVLRHFDFGLYQVENLRQMRLKHVPAGQQAYLAERYEACALAYLRLLLVLFFFIHEFED